MILVTGGTGLIGSRLLFHLTKNEKYKVRSIYRSEDSLKKIKAIFKNLSDEGEKQFSRIEWVKADINNIPELEKAFRGVVFVFHVAGFISFKPTDFDKLIKINVEGTANIVNLCIDFKIKKLCHVSSIATITSVEEKILDENSEWNPEASNNDYAISKHGGEMEVWRGSQEGLKVLIVNPSVVLGAYFWDSGSGTLFKRVANRFPFFPTGGTGFVDVDDVVRAMIAFQFSEVENQRFILNGSNQTYQHVMKTIATHLGVLPPHKKVSHNVLRLLARIDGLLSFLQLKKRTLTLRNADSVSLVSSYDGSKVSQFIDFHYTDFEESIKNICKQYPLIYR